MFPYYLMFPGLPFFTGIEAVSAAWFIYIDTDASIPVNLDLYMPPPSPQPAGSQAQATAPQEELCSYLATVTIWNRGQTAADTRKSSSQNLKGNEREAKALPHIGFYPRLCCSPESHNSQFLSSPGKNSLQLESFIRAIETPMEECTWVDSLITPSLIPVWNAQELINLVSIWAHAVFQSKIHFDHLIIFPR